MKKNFGSSDEEVLEAAEQISEAVAFEKIKEAPNNEDGEQGLQALLQEDLQVLLIDGSLC